MSVNPELPYDVFISYSHQNCKWVHDFLCPLLVQAALRICIDDKTFPLGSPLLVEIERAIRSSHKTVIILTPDYLKSEWCQFENIVLQTLDPSAQRRQMIPVLLEHCELPLRIKALTYLDITCDPTDEDAASRLINSIRSEIPCDPISNYPYPIGGAIPPKENLPQVLFEAITIKDGGIDIAFSIFNLSPEPLVISNILLRPFYMKILKLGGWVHSPVRLPVDRTRLVVDLRDLRDRLQTWKSIADVSYLSREEIQVQSFAPDERQMYIHDETDRDLSLLGPDKTFHMDPHSVHSFLISIMDQVEQYDGFLCFFSIAIQLSAPKISIRMIEAESIIEVSQLRTFESPGATNDKRTRRLSVRLHPSDQKAKLLKVYLLSDSPEVGPAIEELSQEIETESFSSVFLFDLACQVSRYDKPRINKILRSFLRLTTKADPQTDQDPFILALEQLLKDTPQEFQESDYAFLKSLYKSCYPPKCRLMAGRLLTGLAAFGNEKTALSSSTPLPLVSPELVSAYVTCEELRELASSILSRENSTGKDQALITLLELGDEESFRIIAEFTFQKARYSPEIDIGIRALERLSGKRFAISERLSCSVIIIMWAITVLILVMSWKPSWVFVGSIVALFLAFLLPAAFKRVRLYLGIHRARSWFTNFFEPP